MNYFSLIVNLILKRWIDIDFNVRLKIKIENARRSCEKMYCKNRKSKLVLIILRFID